MTGATPSVAKTDLQFTPSLEEFFSSRMSEPYTALAGANNSGKSLVLKWLKASVGRTAHMIGVNRFYHLYHIGSGIRNPAEIDQYEQQFQQNFWQEQYNYEQNYIDLNRIILNLNNERRDALFDLCGELLGVEIGLKKVDDHNELSPWVHRGRRSEPLGRQ